MASSKTFPTRLPLREWFPWRNYRITFARSHQSIAMPICLPAWQINVLPIKSHFPLLPQTLRADLQNKNVSCLFKGLQLPAYKILNSSLEKLLISHTNSLHSFSSLGGDFPNKKTLWPFWVQKTSLKQISWKSVQLFSRQTDIQSSFRIYNIIVTSHCKTISTKGLTHTY